MFEAVLGIIPSVLDKIFPDPVARDAAKLKLLELQQAGELKELELSMSAIVEEARSNDPWTSRARPSFLYVIYIMILSSLPIGVVYAFHPSVAHNISTGMKEWLDAIPNDLWALFGAGYLGYTGAVTIEKHKRKKH